MTANGSSRVDMHSSSPVCCASRLSFAACDSRCFDSAPPGPASVVCAHPLGHDPSGSSAIPHCGQSSVMMITLSPGRAASVLVGASGAEHDHVVAAPLHGGPRGLCRMQSGSSKYGGIVRHPHGQPVRLGMTDALGAAESLGTRSTGERPGSAALVTAPVRQVEQDAKPVPLLVGQRRPRDDQLAYPPLGGRLLVGAHWASARSVSNSSPMSWP